MAMQQQQEQQQCIVDVVRQHRIQDTLSSLDVVDDVISVIQTYAKQSKLVFLISTSSSGGDEECNEEDSDNEDIDYEYDEIYYKPSSTIWLFDPSSSSWETIQLNISLHNSIMSDVDAFVSANQVITLNEEESDDEKEEGDERDEEKGNIDMIQKTLNLHTGQVIKTIIRTKNTKDVSIPLPRLQATIPSSPFSFKGHIPVFSSEFANTPPHFFDTKTNCIMKIPSLIHANYLISSPQHDRAFAFIAADHFYEVLLHAIKPCHPPPFPPSQLACYVINENFIYMNRCIDGYSGEWYIYDMRTDRWNLMPGKKIWTGPIKRGVSEIFSDIIDHILFVFYRVDGDYYMHSYKLGQFDPSQFDPSQFDPSQSDDVGEWEEVKVADCFVNGLKPFSLLNCNAMFGI